MPDDRKPETKLSFLVSGDDELQKALVAYMTAIQDAMHPFRPVDAGVFVGALLTIAAPTMHTMLGYDREACLLAMGSAFDSALRVIQESGEA